MPANHVSVSVNRRLALAGSCAPPVPVQGAALRPRFACLTAKSCQVLYRIQRAFGIGNIHISRNPTCSDLTVRLRPPGRVSLCLECLQLFTFACACAWCPCTSATTPLCALRLRHSMPAFTKICEMQHEENCNSFQRRIALCAVAGFRSSSSSLSSSTTTITCNLFVSQFTLALAEASVASFLLQLPLVAFMMVMAVMPMMMI